MARTKKDNEEIIEDLKANNKKTKTGVEKNKKSARFLAAKDLKEKLEQKGIY